MPITGRCGPTHHQRMTSYTPPTYQAVHMIIALYKRRLFLNRSSSVSFLGGCSSAVFRTALRVPSSDDGHVSSFASWSGPSPWLLSSVMGTSSGQTVSRVSNIESTKWISWTLQFWSNNAACMEHKEYQVGILDITALVK